MLYLSPSEKKVSHYHRRTPLLSPLTGAQIHGRGLAHLQMTLIQPSYPQAEISAGTVTATQDTTYVLSISLAARIPIIYSCSVGSRVACRASWIAES